MGWDHSMRKHSGRSKNQVVWPQTTFTQFVSRWWFHDYDNLVWCSGMRRSSMILTVLGFGPSVNDHRLRKHLRKTVCFSCDTYLVINEKVATVEWRGITTPWPWWPPHGHLMVGGQKRTLSNKVHECRTHRLFLEFNVLTSTLKGLLWQALTTNVRMQQLIAKWMTYIWGKINNGDLHSMSMVKSTEIYLFF